MREVVSEHQQQLRVPQNLVLVTCVGLSEFEFPWSVPLSRVLPVPHLLASVEELITIRCVVMIVERVHEESRTWLERVSCVKARCPHKLFLFFLIELLVHVIRHPRKNHDLYSHLCK